MEIHPLTCNKSAFPPLLDLLLFRTGRVQCTLVKTGIISCSRLSGLIKVLFIGVNWYLKSFPLQWQGFFTLNYLGLWMRSCVRARTQRRAAAPSGPTLEYSCSAEFRPQTFLVIFPHHTESRSNALWGEKYPFLRLKRSKICEEITVRNDEKWPKKKRGFYLEKCQMQKCKINLNSHTRALVCSIKTYMKLCQSWIKSTFLIYYVDIYFTVGDFITVEFIILH